MSEVEKNDKGAAKKEGKYRNLIECWCINSLIFFKDVAPAFAVSV